MTTNTPRHFAKYNGAKILNSVAKFREKVVGIQKYHALNFTQNMF